MLVLDFLSEFGVEGDIGPRSRPLGVLEQVEGIDYQGGSRMRAMACSHLRRIEDAQQFEIRRMIVGDHMEMEPVRTEDLNKGMVELAGNWMRLLIPWLTVDILDWNKMGSSKQVR